MPKKLSKTIDYSVDHKVLAIVSNLKDYSLCFHINNVLKLDLVKYDDLFFDLSTDVEKSFSWYYYQDSKTGTTYYLIGNKSEGSILLPTHKTVDYFILIKDFVRNDVSQILTNSLRTVPYISTSYDISIQQIKQLEHLLETIELHELEYVKSVK